MVMWIRAKETRYSPRGAGHPPPKLDRAAKWTREAGTFCPRKSELAAEAEATPKG